MKPIALIGFMGSGKTTVGQMLAQEVSKPCVDLDEAIETREGRPITDIFATEGEDYFRQLEYNVLQEFAREDVIVATGGGIVKEEANRKVLRHDFLTVWLHISYETVAKRLEGDTTRPLWQQPEHVKRALYDSRLSLYESCAETIVEVDHKSLPTLIKEVKRYITVI
ncbi:shikimate kinase [Alkalibacillus flavidus]|uniref:Shikimate kinase n=1 Tax=Alkalibacillus flavidus TaxID=546021 RepID=A0ABV2KXH5_9BACI